MSLQIISDLNVLAKRAASAVDSYFTDYLRNTTTDQEILDFYGDGNIIGRKGIPRGDRALLDAVDDSHKYLQNSSRPQLDRPKYKVGGLDQTVGYGYATKDIPGAISPDTGLPWQMTFGKMPIDFGSSSVTPAAQQFLEDFRIPVNAGNDYSFDTGPNIQDRINFETQTQISNDPFMGRSPDKLQAMLDDIQNQDASIRTRNGQPVTPKTWKELGYINEKPANFKNLVIGDFKSTIINDQGPFSSVSTLTPVEDWNASTPRWRAALYEKEGLAGPISTQPFSTGYGASSNDVQRFTPGKERLLPLQPYTEFYERLDATPPSFKGGAPAPDFTDLQKSIGTRNYLIGRNILDGRGSLGFPVRATRAGLGFTADVTASIPIFDPEFRSAVERGDNWGAARQVAGDYAAGAVATPIIGAAATGAQRIAPRAAAAVLPVATGVTRIANPIAVVSQIGGDGRQTPAQVIADKQAAAAQINRAQQAKDRGGRWGIDTPFGRVTVPELGISESGSLVIGDQSGGRRIGTKAVLNGKEVVWTGPSYGWQSPASARKVGVK